MPFIQSAFTKKSYSDCYIYYISVRSLKLAFDVYSALSRVNIENERMCTLYTFSFHRECVQSTHSPSTLYTLSLHCVHTLPPLPSLKETSCMHKLTRELWACITSTWPVTSPHFFFAFFLFSFYGALVHFFFMYRTIFYSELYIEQIFILFYIPLIT
jgi:hypothetical protein